MAQINKQSQGTPHTTYEGAHAKRLTPVQELRRSVFANLLWEKEFYEDGQTNAERIAELVKQCSQIEVNKITVEARDKMHLRHVPLLLARELARDGRMTSELLYHIIQRPDEITEFLALYWKDGRQPLAAAVKKGLAAAFRKFDEYQLAKYDREGTVRLRDALFLCHAKPLNDEQEAVWKRLVDGKLRTPNTWETRLSAGENKKETFTDLIVTKKIGGLALLRNLRNMIESGMDRALIVQGIRNASFKRVLPFRFISAAIHAPELESELEEAMFHSLSTSQIKLPGRTVLVLDHSGSMFESLSTRSELCRLDAAAGVAMLLREVCEQVAIVAFSSRCNFDGVNRQNSWLSMQALQRVYGAQQPNTEAAVVIPARRGFALRDAYYNSMVWWGTDAAAGVQKAEELTYDRCIVITDEQSQSNLPRPNGLGYVVNVGSYAYSIAYGDWTSISGWSEQVIHWIAESERMPS